MSASSIAASYVAIGRTVNRAIVVLSAAKDLHRLVVLSAAKDLHVRVLHGSASTSTGRFGDASRVDARVQRFDASIAQDEHPLHASAQLRELAREDEHRGRRWLGRREAAHEVRVEEEHWAGRPIRGAYRPRVGAPQTRDAMEQRRLAGAAPTQGAHPP